LVGPLVHWSVGPSVPISLRKQVMSQLLRAWGVVTTLFYNKSKQSGAHRDLWFEAHGGAVDAVSAASRTGSNDAALPAFFLPVVS
jgi:hypothetical protein